MTSAELRETRQALGLTQATMAELMGLTARNYARLEGTRAPTNQHVATVRLIQRLHAAGLLKVANQSVTH